ncbi:MAG: Na+/H+ antiporter subunit E, partial [Alphaproteobacteria bacterium]
ILTPSLPITPELFWMKASQKTDVGRVIHANSITLTPGTVSVEVEGDSILVHSITAEMADGTRSGEMDRYVTRVEGG